MDSLSKESAIQQLGDDAPAAPLQSFASKLGIPALRLRGREDSMEGLRAIRDWETCWLRAIGLAWRDDALKAELLADAPAFLRRHCGYEMPDTMHIMVEEDPGSKWSPNAQGKSWVARPNVLTVFLPAKPDDSRDWAVALADFEGVGTMMPFSFCCC